MTYGNNLASDMNANRGGYQSIPNDLAPMEDLPDWKVADGEIDPRGGDVLGAGGEKIGTIVTLLASPTTQRAHFAVVDTGSWFSNKRFVLPLSSLNFREGRAYGTFMREHFQGAPEWHEGARDYNSYHSYWTGLNTAGTTGSMTAPMAGTAATSGTMASAATTGREEAVIPVVEEEMHVGKQQVEHGVRIVSRVTERPVEEQVRLREEHVTVNRVPADRPLTDADRTAMRDQVVEVTERAEVPVVTKEARVVEEVHVGKEVREHTEAVQGTVRRTEVDIDTDADMDAEEAGLLDTPGTTRSTTSATRGGTTGSGGGTTSRP